VLQLPRGYDDLRRETPAGAIGSLADGTVVLVRGTVRRVHVFPRRLLDVTLEGGLRARWFRAPGAMAKAYVKGSEVALAGPLRTAADGTRELVHPSNLTAALADRRARGAGPGLGIRARYSAPAGVSERLFEKLIAAALARLGVLELDEALPAEARARLGLPGLGEALAAVHAPPDGIDDAALAALAEGRSPAHRRVALEEQLVLQTAFLIRRAEARAQPATPAAPGIDAGAALARVRAALGFDLTAAQARALDEIARDLAGPAPMQRLLIGDVGSGKTAVAFAAAALTAAAGGQTVMMAPTEVLAEQHARTLAPAAARLGLRLGVLTAGLAARARAELGEACAAGQVQLLLGTQALLDPRLAFADLRLVVVDEQHRFGVGQRARLRDRAPHLLVLSATPIPRTLALALHGDLDSSVLGERPGGRPLPAVAVCRGADERRAGYQRLREAVSEGRQAFVVCPVRERARRAGAVTAVARYASLRKELAPAAVGVLHGALASSDKDVTLRAFAGGALSVLVATTVVELGVDVANATVMLVEDADRFGRAQLHQLRGRVGRGDLPGIAFFCASAAAESDALARLDDVAAAPDGFALAEADLAARGFGDLHGTAQSGRAVPGLFATIELARREAEAMLAGDPELARPEHTALGHAARARAAAHGLFDAGAG
jgi:ATP-dependent DNA helicase RecG